MKQNRYLQFFTATIAIMVMSIAGNVAFGASVFECATVLTTGSVLVSFLPSNSFSFLETIVPPIVDITTKDGLLKHLTTMQEDLKKSITADMEVKAKEIAEAKAKEKDEAIEGIKKNLEKLESEKITPEIIKEIKEEARISQKAIDILQTRMKGQLLLPKEKKILTMSEAIGEKMLEIGDIDKNTGQFKSDEVEKALASAGGSFTLKLGTVSLDQKDMTLATTLTGDPVATYNPNQAILPSQKVNVRDLLPTLVSPTGLYVTYQENTGEVNNVAVQTEGALKGQNEYALTEIKTVAKYIAGFAVFTKQLLKFLPWMQTTLVRMLLRDFYKKENSYFFTQISSAATGPFIGGTDPNDAKQLISAIGTQLDTNFNVSFAVINNALMGRLIANTYSTGYYPGAGSVVLNGARGLTIFGVPIVAASWMPANQVLLIDNDYVERIEVEGLNVTFSFEDSDNFRRNKVTAKVECMEEVNILLPQSIMYGSLGAS